MLTNEQCDEFRRLPLSFNDMVRAIYEAGRASKAAEYAHIRREARNAALEEAAKSFDAIRFKAGAETVMYCYRASERIRALKDQP